MIWLFLALTFKATRASAISEESEARLILDVLMR